MLVRATVATRLVLSSFVAGATATTLVLTVAATAKLALVFGVAVGNEVETTFGWRFDERNRYTTKAPARATLSIRNNCNKFFSRIAANFGWAFRI